MANLPETGISPTAAGQFLRCWLALNPPKDVFSIRICPSAPGAHKLSQKLLVEVCIYMFASENRPSAALQDLPLILFSLLLSAFSL
jgi:hypothetical protein